MDEAEVNPPRGVQGIVSCPGRHHVRGRGLGTVRQFGIGGVGAKPFRRGTRSRLKPLLPWLRAALPIERVALWRL